MRIYLDNCCYNRPFDDQRNLATALESFANVVWMGGAAEYVETTDEIIERAKDFEAMGVKKMDALHLASAEAASCDWFSTTDKGILRKVRDVGGMRVANPVEFITWRKDND